MKHFLEDFGICMKRLAYGKGMDQEICKSLPDVFKNVCQFLGCGPCCAVYKSAQMDPDTLLYKLDFIEKSLINLRINIS